jgi:putative membrane protein
MILKKILNSAVIITLAGLTFSWHNAFAQGLNAEDALQSVLKEIRQTQRIDSLTKIDCRKVSYDQLVELGEVILSIIHPDEKERVVIDKLVGGKGSEEYTAMVYRLGERYLGCRKSSATGWPDFGTIAEYEQTYPDWNGGRMMNGHGSRHFAYLLFVVAAIAAMIFLALWARGLGRRNYPPSGEMPLLILQRRYAKGELSGEEFERMKKDLAAR